MPAGEMEEVQKGIKYRFEAVLFQEPGDALGIVFVHLAPEGAHHVLADHAQRVLASARSPTSGSDLGPRIEVAERRRECRVHHAEPHAAKPRPDAEPGLEPVEDHGVLADAHAQLVLLYGSLEDATSAMLRSDVHLPSLIIVVLGGLRIAGIRERRFTTAVKSSIGSPVTPGAGIACRPWRSAERRAPAQGSLRILGYMGYMPRRAT